MEFGKDVNIDACKFQYKFQLYLGAKLKLAMQIHSEGIWHAVYPDGN